MAVSFSNMIKDVLGASWMLKNGFKNKKEQWPAIQRIKSRLTGSKTELLWDKGPTTVWKWLLQRPVMSVF
jgi:hypothetical protein